MSQRSKGKGKGWSKIKGPVDPDKRCWWIANYGDGCAARSPFPLKASEVAYCVFPTPRILFGLGTKEDRDAIYAQRGEARPPGRERRPMRDPEIVAVEVPEGYFDPPPADPAAVRWLRAPGARPRKIFEELVGGDPADAPPIVPIDSLFGTGERWLQPADDGAVALLHGADLIIGVDRASGHEFLMYGRAVLEELARTGGERDLRIVRIGMDPATDDLEKLAAAIVVVKGRCAYPGYGADA
jgi:hypothetical protein